MEFVLLGANRIASPLKLNVHLMMNKSHLYCIYVENTRLHHQWYKKRFRQKQNDSWRHEASSWPPSELEFSNLMHSDRLGDVIPLQSHIGQV